LRPVSIELKRSLRLFDGLAMVVGIIIGSGIFRTPGLVAQQLGRPWLTFAAWLLGGVLAFLGTLCFAELATRFPKAGGKYVYAREAFGGRVGFVVGWVEGLAIYTAAIAALGVAAAEFSARLAGWPETRVRWIAVLIVAAFTGINLLGINSGRWVQNVVTGAKVLALGGVVVMAFFAGNGAGWHGALPGAPSGARVWGALAAAAPAVIWSYYGSVDAGKIAEEVVEPDRTLPRIFLLGIAVVSVLYLLLNAAFLYVLPFDQVATSTLVAGDVAAAIFGRTGGAIITVLALLVVLASLNGNVFVTPRVIFGLSRDGLGPALLTRVNGGQTPWTAMALVGLVSMALAASGTFTELIALAVALILLIDGLTVASLFRLRAERPAAPFLTPFYPYLPVLFITVYAALLYGTVLAQPQVVLKALAVLGIVWGLSRLAVSPAGTGSRSPSPT